MIKKEKKVFIKFNWWQSHNNTIHVISINILLNIVLFCGGQFFWLRKMESQVKKLIVMIIPVNYKVTTWLFKSEKTSVHISSYKHEIYLKDIVLGVLDKVKNASCCIAPKRLRLQVSVLVCRSWVHSQQAGPNKYK